MRLASPPSFDGRRQPVLARAPGSRRPLVATRTSPRPASRGPGRVIPPREEIPRRRGGLLSLPERFAPLPEGVTPIPEGSVTPTTPPEIGKETTPPLRPGRRRVRRGRASFKISTRRGRLARQRRREGRPPAPLGSKIFTFEGPRVPRLLPPLRVMNPSGSRRAPSRRVGTPSGTLATQIGRPPFRRESPWPRADDRSERAGVLGRVAVTGGGIPASECVRPRCRACTGDGSWAAVAAKRPRRGRGR